MKYQLNGIPYINGKTIPDLLYFYWLDNKIISCKWNNPINPDMISNYEDFLYVIGLRIKYDRSEKDISILKIIYFEGM